MSARLARDSAAELDTQEFLAEVTFLRSFGIGEERVAAKLGYHNFDSYLRRLQRLGVSPLGGSGLAQLTARLAELIASGGEFTIVDFPITADESAIGQLISTAVKRGEIRRVRSKPHPLTLPTTRIGVYRATAGSHASPNDSHDNAGDSLGTAEVA